MKIISFKVSKYKSIYDEVSAECFNGVTVIGKNNSGKTNVLQALKLFFCGRENPELYSYETDFPSDLKSGKTSISIKFSFDQDELADVSEHLANDSESDDDNYEDGEELENPVQEDEAGNIELQVEGKKPAKTTNGRRSLSIRDMYLQLFNMYEDSRLTEPQDDFIIHLIISNKGNLFYSIFSGYTKKKTIKPSKYSYKERNFVDKLLSMFECIYIPSSKSIDELSSALLIPHLRKVAYNAIKPNLHHLNEALDNVSRSINDEMLGSGIEGFELKIKEPITPENVLGYFDISMKDIVENNISSKGMGIQCMSLFSSFKVISKDKSDLGKEVIWLIEEPESFMHPELVEQCNLLFKSLQEVSYVVMTTHAIAFTSNDPTKIMEVYKDNGRTKDKKHIKKYDAVASIRDNLGVKFSDFFGYSGPCLFVEGITDKIYIEGVVKIISQYEGYRDKWPLIRSAHIEDFGGVTQLGGFLRGCYKFLSKDIPAVCILDGDDAGVKERKNLQQYFSSKEKINFSSNRDYVSVRAGFPIEGLFPDKFLLEVDRQYSSWFGGSLGTDAAGIIEPFSIKDGIKVQLSKVLLDLCKAETDAEWAERWILTLDSIEQALEKKKKDCENPLVSHAELP
ncbi:ATP-dependent nuclease [Serratia marcescens]|uniref:ATP-dependent nuclease n=1 Tax=Serratia marcescens TaxID=615 RepID=UPI000D72F23F|nr:AAA family ATPase [Serratia marcescens]AWO80486.1 ATP-dependent endonuclease [Serratia marcescens]